PIEQLASLRAMPGLIVVRPADANETVEAYRLAMPHKSRPVAMILSRQALPVFDRAKFGPASGLTKGAYVLAEAENGQPDVILIGTGSEVALCIEARELLAKENIQVRVVSMPCRELFEEQPEAYRVSVLPPEITARVTVEEASPLGWDRYAGPDGVVLGIGTFGLSAPPKVVAEHFGFTPQCVVEAAKKAMKV
ncbi:MAG: transketolase C-terminal domain-containing protein, partial [Pseudomonadota bacterium]